MPSRDATAGKALTPAEESQSPDAEHVSGRESVPRPIQETGSFSLDFSGDSTWSCAVLCGGGSMSA